ncbi:MAG TPA: hypothetical protein VE732_06565 [Nitrososphaera sp.]|jgi:thymidylate kinase|nr:hypothetical protein [Nitrososphaera sp.]
MLINILGPDGCGKTTQIGKLVGWVNESFDLNARSLAKRDIFDIERFPECNFFGCRYEKLAHELLPIMIDESRALWLFYMNAVLIRHHPPKKNEVVFLDGYWHKHYATEAALGLDEQWLLNVCSFFPEPDVTILLDINPRIIVARNHSHKPYESGCDFSCSDEAFISHQDKVRSKLLRLAQSREYVILQADKSVEALFQEICNLLAPLIIKETH